METRELRYFVAVAEELNFGRAAKRLQMAQPPLSRAIQQIERRLGVVLLERAGRSFVLSGAGRVLLEEGRVALEAVEAAQRRTQRAGVSPDRVVIAAKAGAHGDLLNRILLASRKVPGGATMDIQLVGPGEPERMVRDGTADAALLLEPYDQTHGFDRLPLRTEGQQLLVPIGHVLAGLTHTSMAQIHSMAGLPQPRWPEPDGAFLTGSGPAVRDYMQLLQSVSLGQACALVPESAPILAHVAAVPVADAEAVTTVLAWPAHRRSTPVDRLIMWANDATDGP